MRRIPYPLINYIWSCTASLYIGYYQQQRKKQHQYKLLDPRKAVLEAITTIPDMIGVLKN